MKTALTITVLVLLIAGMAGLAGFAGCASSGPAPKAAVGPQDSDQVDATLLAHKKTFSDCFNAGQKRAGDAAGGRVMTAFTVGVDGKVKSAMMKEDHLPVPGVSDCILKALRSMQFPAPKAGLELQVEYPFVFAPVK